MKAIFSLPRSGSTLLQALMYEPEFCFEKSPNKDTKIGKWVKPHQHRSIIRDFNPEIIILVRDIRDIVASYLHYNRIRGRVNNIVEERIPPESEKLVDLAKKHPHTLVRYEELVTNPEKVEKDLGVTFRPPEKLFEWVYRNGDPKRREEMERHNFAVNGNSIGRWKDIPGTLEIADQCMAYQEYFGYVG